MRWFSCAALICLALAPSANARCGGINALQQGMINEWKLRLDGAVDRFASQPESASTAADAALTTCDDAMLEFLNENVACNSGIALSLRKGNFRSEAIARTMAWRAANSKPGAQSPPGECSSDVAAIGRGARAGLPAAPSRSSPETE